MLLAFWRKLKGFCLWSIEHYCAPRLWGWGGGGGVRPCNGQTGKLCVRLTGSQHGRHMLCVVRGQAWYVCIVLYSIGVSFYWEAVFISLCHGGLFSVKTCTVKISILGSVAGGMCYCVESRITGGTAVRIDSLHYSAKANFSINILYHDFVL